MTSPKLNVTPEVVMAVSPCKTASDMIEKAASKEDFRCWSDCGYGSGYYVELPCYLNGLIQAGKEDEAQAIANRAFAGNGIPNDDWRAMVKFREEHVP